VQPSKAEKDWSQPFFPSGPVLGRLVARIL